MNKNKIPKGTIIIGFPCIGKTTTSQKMNNVIDLESSVYSYNDDILKNKYNNNQEKAKGDPDRKLIDGWLDNYISDIKKKNTEYDYVFTASFPELIDRLLAEDLQLAIVMPENNDEVKNIYNQRSINRGNLDSWRLKFINNFSNYIEYNLEKYSNKIPIYQLKDNQYLIDLLHKK